MKKFFILLLLFFIGCTGTKVSEDEIKEANQFFESIFLDQVQESPEFQTRLGYNLITINGMILLGNNAEAR
tara:strand:- start:131 stop:343 length:213 start_codon:yes stop_codon:yes gene_type:complete